MCFRTVACLLLAAASAAAQPILGTVRDSASRLLIPGVVVELHDAAGAVLGRTLTNGAGRFALPADARASSVRPRPIMIVRLTLSR